MYAFGIFIYWIDFSYHVDDSKLILDEESAKGLRKYVHNENKILLLFERAGEVLVTCLLLIFSDFNIQGITAWMIWLIAAFVLMIMYELYWIRYFKSEKTMKDFYSSIMGIPVAGATLPVIACCLIAIYGRNPMLFVSTIILG